jgi:hypothetical protein
MKPSTATRQVVASFTNDFGLIHDEGDPVTCRSLTLRVVELERVFQDLVPLNDRSFISREAESERPLAYLRHKVGEELEKPLGCRIAFARKQTKAHAVLQQALSINTYCTLAKFEIY